MTQVYWTEIEAAKWLRRKGAKFIGGEENINKWAIDKQLALICVIGKRKNLWFRSTNF